MKRPYMISDKYCSTWKVTDAIREIIANAIDTGEEISVDFLEGTGVVRNMETSLEKKYLLLGESSSRSNQDAIGQFGEGFKIAALIFCRNNRRFSIRSRNQQYDFTLERDEEFESGMLTVDISEVPVSIQGTEVSFSCSEEELNYAKSLFLKLSPVEEIEHGILNAPGKIYVSGVRVANDYGTLFGYSLNDKSLLNRDRTILNKSKVATEICSLLNRATSLKVITEYIQKAVLSGAEDSNNESSDYLEHTFYLYPQQRDKWKTAIKNLFGNKVAISCRNPEIDSRAKYLGYKVLNFDDHVNSAIRYATDLPWTSAVAPKCVAKTVTPTPEEEKVIKKAKYYMTAKMHLPIGEVFVAEEIDNNAIAQREGMKIFLNRSIASDFPQVFASLCHEMAHIESGFGDCSSSFESQLTDFFKILADNLWNGKKE